MTDELRAAAERYRQPYDERAPYWWRDLGENVNDAHKLAAAYLAEQGDKDRYRKALVNLKQHLEYDGGAACDIPTMIRIVSDGLEGK